jgi:3-deoxy-D-manno-octulosonic-acid transferase
VQQTLKRAGGGHYLGQRFGLPPISAEERPIWFHAASVGELRLIAPLMDASLHHRALLTCNTPDAYRLARQLWGDRITTRYCPLDFVWAVRSLIRAYQPRVLFVAETEIWPELYRQCQQLQVAIHIVNGRISDKTLNAAFPASAFIRTALDAVTTVWARSDLDRQRFIDLGCAADKVTVTGSLKMGRVATRDIPEHPLTGKPYSLAVSTHPDEEVIVAKAWRASGDTHQLALIPRHPERGPTLAAQLESEGFRVTRRSLTLTPPEETDIYIADTLGEVDAFCAHAALVFMGGSMVPHGGHNVFEAAAWGKPIIVGPHTHNFDDEVAYLREHDAIATAETEQELAAQWRLLCADNNHRERLTTATVEACAALPDREAEYLALVADAISRHASS